MSLRETFFAACLFAAAAAGTWGVLLVSEAAAWMVGGLLFAAWSWLVFSE